MAKIIRLKGNDGKEAYSIGMHLGSNYNGNVNGVWRELALLPLRNGEVNSSNGHFTPKDNAPVSSDVMVIPEYPITLHVKLPDNLRMNMYSGYRINLPNDTDSHSCENAVTSIANGASFTFPTGPAGEDGYPAQPCMYRAEFYYGSNYNTYPSYNDIENLIKNGEIKIMYFSKSGDVFSRNYEQEKLIRGISMKSTSSTSSTRRHIFAHASDFHGDVYRMRNFLDFCGAFNHNGYITPIITGDTVAQTTHDGCAWAFKELYNYGGKWALTTGNHDVCCGGDFKTFHVNLNAWLKRIGVTLPSGIVNNSASYYSITIDNTVIICIDQYDNLARPGYNISQTQAQWIIDTLKNVPSGNNILIAMHQMEVPIDPITGNTEFFEQTMKYDDSAKTERLQTGDLLTKLIDAFIGRTTTGNISVTNLNGSSYTISADFSTAKGTFVAFLSGHTHRDRIGYNTGTTHKQLHMNISCACAGYAYQRDLPNNGGLGASQDVFNVFAINNDTNEVEIVRVGATYNVGNTRHPFYMKVKFKD